MCLLVWPALADVETLVRQGVALQQAGHNREAIAALEQATTLAEKSGDRRLLVLAKSSLGAVCTCSRQAAATEKNLRESLTLAHELADTNTAAVVQNNLGNFLAAQGKLDEALAVYDAAGTPSALANAAAIAIRDAEPRNLAAQAKLTGLTVTPEIALLWLRCGQTDVQLQQLSRAERCFTAALQCDNPRVQTYALGYLGQLKQSLDLIRHAAFVAQEHAIPEALYRWEWQTGRLLAAAGKRSEAIAAYRRAVQSLQPIRAELTQGCGAARPTFRESVAPVYYELADLLLQRDDALAEAREAIELLKSAELDDYLQDECAGQARSRSQVEKVAANTAIIHIIPLADRTEVLLAFNEGLERVKLPVDAAKLTAEVRQFRVNLEQRSSNRYLTQARQLYAWLIAPLKETLARHKVETLVFVPDGALRTVPLAALNDGERFLIEQFAVAVTPGVTLMDARAMPAGQLKALAAGLSKGVQNFAPLPNVPGELKMVASAFHGPVLLDGEFATAVLRRDFEHEQYQVVHFATHGQVDKDISKSFILTHDGRLTLDELEALLRPGQFRGKPVELLTLSACQTAAGDDRAALGLAGVAVKAGARSALATLWFVHDESTAMLMEEFYRGARTTSKAKALQRAQVKVLRDPRFEHAGYWAPYLMIGNWL